MAKKASKKTSIIDMGMFCTAKKAMEIEKTKTMLNVSPSIDLRLGGGILEGSFVLIQGKAKCGKTLTCMEIALNALTQGRWVVYFDTENRLTASKYFAVQELDILNHPNFLLLNSESSDSDKVISGDEMYSTILQMMKIPKFRGAVFIIDSLSDVITQDVLDDPKVSAQRRDSTPKLNADFCKKVGPFIRKSNSIVIGVQHLQQDISPTGHGALKPVGGDRLNYRCDYVLLSKHNPLNLEGNTVNGGFSKGGEAIDGLLIRYDIPSNKLLAPFVAKDPSEKVQNYYKFGLGCWWAREALDVLKEFGLVSQGGAYYTFMTEKISSKVKGTEATLELIENNKEYFKKVFADYYIETHGINYNFTPTNEEEDDD